MTASLRPDMCVIGASEAGRAVAMGAVAMGCSVVMVDDGDPSGRCNRDLTLETLRNEARRAATEPEACWAALREALSRGGAERSHARLAAMNIRLIAATGRFRDSETLDADGTIIRARRFVIAAGRARPQHPAGADLNRLQDLARWPSRPERGHLRGDDPEAVSAAQSLCRLGTAVTMTTGEPMLPGIDPELAAPVLARLRQDGVMFLGDNHGPSDAPPTFAEALTPALDALALDRAGVARACAGLSLTPALRTTNPRVFAVGCPAGARSTASGLPQAGVVLRAALLRLPVRARAGFAPEIVLTDPEIAQVGLTEAAARERGAVNLWRWPLGQTGPGFADAGTSGHLKVVTDRRGRILGAGIVGPHARELIGFWTLALTRRLGLADLADVPLPLPSWTEAMRGVVLGHTARRLANPWVRRSLDVMRRLM